MAGRKIAAFLVRSKALPRLLLLMAVAFPLLFLHLSFRHRMPLVTQAWTEVEKIHAIEKELETMERGWDPSAAETAWTQGHDGYQLLFRDLEDVAAWLEDVRAAAAQRALRASYTLGTWRPSGEARDVNVLEVKAQFTSAATDDAGRYHAFGAMLEMLRYLSSREVRVDIESVEFRGNATALDHAEIVFHLRGVQPGISAGEGLQAAGSAGEERRS